MSDRILIVEDEPRIAAILKAGLEENGFYTTTVDDGKLASQLARSEDFDLLILDLALPGLFGVNVIESLRERGEHIPIIVLTVFQDIQDKVRALEAGANDYMTKPFSLEELVARIRVQLRQQRSPMHTENLVLSVGELVVDLRRRAVQHKGNAIELSAREFALLEILVRYAGQAQSREDLLNQVWGLDYDSSSNIVDVYIGYLRKKLGQNLIKTVRGVGYRLQVNS
ncbi:MAG TPA: response regulator transcription factor [Leptolyngbyaceae cyanobacterium M33_DOE_097]|uniref:Response regulator transcription factor n=1 Tax=Oscillatoriales cyanobacterium SpSt-418 TaxID=2282169 RepID=A0A7C3PD74_9CYAN|nr:response regulator transcription factor [Leptolyngbyaceae cyanobacterium M33_DOE_097]